MILDEIKENPPPLTLMLQCRVEVFHGASHVTLRGSQKCRMHWWERFRKWILVGRPKYEAAMRDG